MARSYSTSEEELRRIERAYGGGNRGKIEMPEEQALREYLSGLGGAPPVTPAMSGATPPPAQNAIQRWQRQSIQPPDASTRGQPFGAPGISVQRAYSAQTGGRVDMRAYQSPLDTTPSATQPQTSFGQGATGTDQWRTAFAPGLPRPSGHSYSWETGASSRPATTGAYQGALAAGGAIRPAPAATPRGARYSDPEEDEAVTRRMDAMAYNRTGTMSPALRERRRSSGGWSPY